MPIFISNNGNIAQKIIQHFPKKMLHGEVTLTMTAVRDQYKIPKLRQLTKIIIMDCYGCKRYHIKPYQTPLLGQLTKARTLGIRTFQVIDLDFEGPIMHEGSKENKFYLLLFTFSLNPSGIMAKLRICTCFQKINCTIRSPSQNIFRQCKTV